MSTLKRSTVNDYVPNRTKVAAQNNVSDISVPNLPTIVEGATQMDNTQIKRDRSINFGFIGLGQGGGRLAAAFKKYGYKVLAINTSRQDLDGLHLDDAFKLAIADDGAGKDMPKGEGAVKERVAIIRNKIEEVFPEHFERSRTPKRIILCAGSGGGTGAGALSEMVDVLEYLNFSGKIGIILALPQDTEDSKAKQNTITVLGKLVELSNAEKIAPLIVLPGADLCFISASVIILLLE